MSSPEAVRRMVLWAIELSEFDIQYRSLTAIKGQVVANFIAEFTNVEGRGQKNLIIGASTWMGRLISTQAESM